MLFISNLFHKVISLTCISESNLIQQQHQHQHHLMLPSLGHHLVKSKSYSFNSSTTKTIPLAPSCINFLKLSDKTSLVVPDEKIVMELSERMSESVSVQSMVPAVPSVCCKMQVTVKDGEYFALNNTSLHVMRQLEKEGKCEQVEVEVVPLSKVPTNVQHGMVVDKEKVKKLVNEKKANRNRDCRTNNSQAETSKCAKKTKGMYSKVHLQEQDNEDNKEEDNPTCSSHSTKQNNKCCKSTTKRCISCSKKLNSVKEQQPSGSKESDEEDDEEEDNSEEEEGEEEEEGDDDEESSDDSEESTSSSSDEEEEVDTLMCNVCDKTFATARQLTCHQSRQKHFGCSVCDTVFPSLSVLEKHKEMLDHWSDGEAQDEEEDDGDQEDEEQDKMENRESKKGVGNVAESRMVGIGGKGMNEISESESEEEDENEMLDSDHHSHHRCHRSANGKGIVRQPQELERLL